MHQDGPWAPHRPSHCAGWRVAVDYGCALRGGAVVYRVGRTYDGSDGCRNADCNNRLANAWQVVGVARVRRGDVLRRTRGGSGDVDGRTGSADQFADSAEERPWAG